MFFESTTGSCQDYQQKESKEGAEWSGKGLEVNICHELTTERLNCSGNSSIKM
jgi:hypothetical protein